MKQINLGNTGLSVPEIAVGCMRFSGMDKKELASLISASLEMGMNFFDHADIYGGGRSEEVFAQSAAYAEIPRDRMILQTKCGIRRGFFDFSKEHILASADSCLKRLNTDYIDILLLHRPDTLMEPEEVAAAFDTLQKAGKVRYFGVSNQNGGQMELLQKAMSQKIAANQLQLSIAHTPMLNSGFNVNMTNNASVNHDGGVLEYCRLRDITIQAWSPFQFGFFGGAFIDHPDFAELNKCLDTTAEKYGVTKSAIAIAWILRHPAKMQAVLGTTKLSRIIEIEKASHITLSREDWYALYRSAGNILP